MRLQVSDGSRPARSDRKPSRLPPGPGLALRRVVEHLYGFDHLPSEEEMASVADPWRPYRSLAVSLLFASELEKGK